MRPVGARALHTRSRRPPNLLNYRGDALIAHQVDLVDLLGRSAMKFRNDGRVMQAEDVVSSRRIDSGFRSLPTALAISGLTPN